MLFKLKVLHVASYWFKVFVLYLQLIVVIAFAASTFGAEGPYYPKPSNPAYSKSYEYVSWIPYFRTSRQFTDLRRTVQL